MHDDLILWLVRQSVMALALGGVVLLLDRWLRDRPRVAFWAWNLVLVRFLWPAEWGLWRLRDVTTRLGTWVVPAEWTAPLSLDAEPSVVLGTASSGIGWREGLPWLWALGVLLVVGRWLWSRRRHVRIATKAVTLTDAERHELAPDLTWPARMSVALSSSATSPFTLGLVRRRVVVPTAFRTAPAAHRSAVLAHELAHLERNDELWLGFEHVVCCLFFFHPMAWLAARRASLARELLCDARALTRSSTCPSDYARALVLVPRRTDATVASAFTPTRHALELRIRAVLRRDVPSNWFPGMVVVLIGLLTLAVGGPVVATSSPAPLVVDPLPGARVSSAFGPRLHPIVRARRHHDGIDLVMPHGTSVRAAGDGVVRRASSNGRGRGASGLMVLIDHGGGRSTFYAHLSAVDVESGQRVRGGQRIGAVGRTGRVTGTHLHFEVREANAPRNPALTFPDWELEQAR